MKGIRRFLFTLVSAVALIAWMSCPVFAATTADVTVTATPAYVSIADNATTVDFGIVATSITSNTSTSHIAINNTSTVQTDMTISVTTANWSGGVEWTHSDTATPGADTAGLNSNNSTWGTGDVIVKYASPNYIYENCPIGVDFTYGLSLVTPTSYTDSAEKTITVRVTAAAG